MKMTDVTVIADLYRVQDHGRLTAVHIPKHSLFRLKITVGCRLKAYPSIRVCGVWCEGGVSMCCERVCTLGVVCTCCGVVLWCTCCGVVLFCVVRLGMRKTPPCADSKRLRVYPENARMFISSFLSCSLSFLLSLFFLSVLLSFLLSLLFSALLSPLLSSPLLSSLHLSSKNTYLSSPDSGRSQSPRGCSSGAASLFS